MPVILGHSGSKLSRGPLGGAAHGAVSLSSAVCGAAGGVPGAPVRLAHPCGRRLGSLRCGPWGVLVYGVLTLSCLQAGYGVGGLGVPSGVGAHGERSRERAAYSDG